MYNRIRSEDTEQIGVIQWAMYARQRMPELEWLHHIPNGGKRNQMEARKLKEMGVRAGIPDLFLPAPKGGYAGLYIEMKWGKNKTTENQDRAIAFLRQQGYRVEVCYGGSQTIEVIKDYLRHKRTELTEEETKR